MFHSVRRLSRMLVMGVSTASLAVAGFAAVAIQPGPALAASPATGGSGASLPYTEVLAQNSPTTGTVIGPSYTQGQLADEAVGRQAVTLAGNGSGQSVTFTTPVATNSIDFRYSIPDSSDGSVYTAPLSLYINGVKQTDFTLTNAYSWYYGSYPFVNTPSSGTPMHFYDEVHRLFSTTYPQSAPRSSWRSTRRTPRPRTRSTWPTSRTSPRRWPSPQARYRSSARAPTRPASTTRPPRSTTRSPRPARAGRSGSRRAPTTSPATSSSTT